MCVCVSHHITGLLRIVPYPCCSFITVGLWRFTWILRLVGALNHRGLGNQAVDCEWVCVCVKGEGRGSRLEDRSLDEKSIWHESPSAQIIYPLTPLHLPEPLEWHATFALPTYINFVSPMWHGDSQLMCLAPAVWMPIKKWWKDSFESEVMAGTQAQ